MRIEPFRMERWQSLHEHAVEVNLSDSGVHPLTLEEALEPAELAELQRTRLVYTQTNGTPELRRAIAAMYPGADADNVEVVNGGAEANFIAAWSLVEPGDEVVMMVPNYMQLPGLVNALGATLKPWTLRPDFVHKRWIADMDELAKLVTPRTRLVALCHPNNPTGARLNVAELETVGRIADKHGAWVLSDEIYAGSELDGSSTPTMWGRCERPIVTSSLSKAYGLPGLRLGWIVAPPQACEDFWEHHDYTSIGPGAASDFVATKILAPKRRAAHLERMRSHLRVNYDVIAAWLARHSERLRFIPPEAGAMLYATYDAPVGSGELARRLLEEESCLLVPGDQYGMERWLRIGFGGDKETVSEGLRRVERVLARVAAT